MAHWLGETDENTGVTSALECLTDYPELDEVMNAAVESYVYDLMNNDMSDAEFFAMEGVNVDAARMVWDTIKSVHSARKEMNAAKKEGKMAEAAKKAKQIAGLFGDLDKKVSKLDQSVSSAAIVNIALAIASLAAVAGASVGLSKAGGAAGKKVANSQAFAKGGKVEGGVRDAVRGVEDAMTKARRNARNALPKQKGIKGIVNTVKTGAKDFGEDAIKTTKRIGQLDAGSKAASSISAAVRGNAEKAGKIAGAAIPGAVAGGTAIGAFLKKKGADKDKGKLQPNDINALIQAIRSTCQKAKQHYLDLASSFTAAKESFEALEAEYATEGYGYDGGDINLLDLLMGQ